MQPGKTHWIKGLDSLRFFLALIVLLSHLPDPFVALLKSSHTIAGALAGIMLNHSINGVAAVIAFFLISGFIIHYPYVGAAKIDIVPFLVRRWLRLGIPMCIVILIAKHYHLSGLPFWSLVCELIYYTLYPLLFIIKVKWKLKFYVSFIISLIAIAILNVQNLESLIHQRNINFHGTYACNGLAFTWIIGFPCWLLGVLIAERIDAVAYKVTTLKILLWRITVLAGSMLCLALKAHLFVSYVVSLNFYALLLYPWIEREIIYYKDHKPVVLFEWMGKFSYSLYIVHKPIFLVLAFYLPLHLSTYFIYLLISFIIAYVFFLVIEYPSHLLARMVSRFQIHI